MVIEYPAERIILRGLIAALISLAMCYLYFVSSSVINIMARKEALSRSVAINASIGSLESRYFALSQSITPNSAVAVGLTPIAATDYVERPGTVSIAGTEAENRI
jgi:type II secretory pathway component PulM